MFAFGEKHPIRLEIILILVSFLAVILFSVVGNLYYLHPDFSTSVGRIAVGIALLILYRKAFAGQSHGKHLIFVFPALLFAAWNVWYNLSSGASFGGKIFFLEALLTASAPALFEEVLFRGIFLYNLKKNGSCDLKCLLISSLIFSVIHLTNIVGADPTSVALQTVYAFVIGMVLAAVYLRNNSILQVIVVHFLIDYSNRLYLSEPSSTSNLQLALFFILLIAEAFYAVMLIRHTPGEG